MGVPLLLGSSSNTLSAAERFGANSRGLRLLGWTGLLAVILGASDLLFAAATLAQEEAREPGGGFVAVATAFGHLMLLGAGTAALTISAVCLDAEWYRRAVGVLCAVLALGLLVIVLFWSGSAVHALRAELPVVQRANAREVARVLVSAIGFGALFVALSAVCLRSVVIGVRAPAS